MLQEDFKCFARGPEIVPMNPGFTSMAKEFLSFFEIFVEFFSR
jgi:hypothetical protein